MTITTVSSNTAFYNCTEGRESGELSRSPSPVRRNVDNRRKHNFVSFDIDGTLTPECLYNAQSEKAVNYFMRHVSLTSPVMIEVFAEKFAKKLSEALPPSINHSGKDAFTNEIKKTVIAALEENKDKSLFENTLYNDDIYDLMTPHFTVRGFDIYNTRRQAVTEVVQELLENMNRCKKGIKKFDPTARIEFKAPHEVSSGSGMMFSGAKKLLEDTKNAMLQFVVPGAIVHVVLISNAIPNHVESFAKNAGLEKHLVSETKGVSSPIQSHSTTAMLQHTQSRSRYLYRTEGKPNPTMFTSILDKLGIPQENVGYLVHIGNSAPSDGKFVENVRGVLPKAEAVEFIEFAPEGKEIIYGHKFGDSVRRELQEVLGSGHAMQQATLQ